MSRTREEDFLASVETAKEHIRDGDVFQVVISQRFELRAARRPRSTSTACCAR